MKAVAVLLFAGCLAVASAALPNHPFFTGNQLAATKSADGRYGGYEPDYYEYDKQRLVLRGKTVCNGNLGDDVDFSYVIGLDCAKDNRREESLLDVSTNTAGFCLYQISEDIVGVPGTTAWIGGTFTAQCYLKSNSPDCHLDQCDNAVMQVEGIYTYDDYIVWEDEPQPLIDGPCNVPDDKKTQKGTQQNHWAGWAERLQRTGRTPAAAKKQVPARGPGGEDTLWQGPGVLLTGIAQTYDSHGKLLGTGTFHYAEPTFYGVPITTAEAGNAKRYTTYLIKTGINAIKSDEHYHN